MIFIRLAPLFFFCSFIYMQTLEYDQRILSSLISLHEKNCGTVPLCAFKSLNISYVSRACCMSCSCERDCWRKGACCSDYLVMDAKHSNRTEVVAYLESIKTFETEQRFTDPAMAFETISLNIDGENDNTSAAADVYVNVAETLLRALDVLSNITGSRNYVNSTYLGQVVQGDNDLMFAFGSAERDKNSACVTAQLRNTNSLDMVSALDLAYEMIDSCWKNETNDELVNQCVNLTINNTMDEKRLIPVTSLASLKTYRNIYCLQCNEGRNGNFVILKTLHTCYASALKHKTVEPTKWWLITDLAFCNIVFEPPEQVKNYTNKCKHVDIDTCPEFNTTNTEIETYKNTLKSMCNRFRLPVYEPKYQGYTVYANIACYLCHREQLHPSLCKEYDKAYSKSAYMYQLEIDTELINVYNTHLNSTLKKLFSANCQNGFIYDEETASCRKVLCPRYLIIDDGVCTPFLLQTRNIFYTIFLKVKVNASKLYPNEADFYAIFVTYINAVSNNTFGDNVVTVWKDTNSSEISVLLLVRPNMELYAETLHKILNFIWKISQYSFPGLSSVYPEIKIQDEDVVKSEDIKIKLSKLNISYPANQWTEKEFRLSNINFCPRIAMNASETKLIGRQFLQLRTGKRVARENVDVTNASLKSFPNSSPEYLVCIEDVFPYRSPRNDSVIQYRKTFTSVAINTNGTVFEPSFVINVAALLVTVVILVTIQKVYVARRRQRRRTQGDQPSSTSHVL